MCRGQTGGCLEGRQEAVVMFREQTGGCGDV